MMTYTIDDVRASALAFCGETLPESEAGLFTVLCEAACRELEAALVRKPGDEGLFVSAAGLLAVSEWLRLRESDNVTDFKAGSVELRAVGSTAAVYRAQAYGVLRGYVKSADFAFVGVDG